MSNDIIWMGGEDIDFPNNVMASYADPYSSTGWDTNYSRTGIRSSLGISNQFEGISNNIWLQFYCYNTNVSNNIPIFSGVVFDNNYNKIISVGDSGSNQAYVKIYNGTSWTTILTTTGTVGGQNIFTLYISDLSSSATVSLYKNNTLLNTATVDLSSYSLSAVTNVCVSANFTYIGVSEIMLANYDIRGCRLKTIALNADGDVNTFDYGVYTDINDINVNDATQIYTATDGKKFLANCTGMPSGDWVVKAVKIASRCVDGLGTLGARLGLKSGGTEDYETTPQNCSGYWQTKERMMLVNPVTGVPFTPAEIEAIQIGVESGTV